MCDAADCERTVYARGYCSRHYKQLLRHGAVQPDPAPDACAVESCARAAVTRGWCQGHYVRWHRTGDVRADVPLVRDVRDSCSVEGCERGRHSTDLCRGHYERSRRFGSPTAGGPLRTVTGDGFLHRGYRQVPVPPRDRWLTGGATTSAEHRLVMARQLGRPLLADESVHHRNGDRTDNRLENLELWSRYQPAGQRVDDKLAWARDLFRRYDADVCSALGLDLDPDTGLPYAESPASS